MFVQYKSKQNVLSYTDFVFNAQTQNWNTEADRIAEPECGAGIRNRNTEPEYGTGIRNRNTEPEYGTGMRNRNAEPECGIGMRNRNTEPGLGIKRGIEDNKRNYG